MTIMRQSRLAWGGPIIWVEAEDGGKEEFKVTSYFHLDLKIRRKNASTQKGKSKSTAVNSFIIGIVEVQG